MEYQYRRKAPRRNFEGFAGILYQGQLTITRCTQLGEGGALIFGKGPLSRIEKDDEIVVTLFLPSIGGLVATATCVYVSDKKMIGLQFNALEMEYKKKVREFVSRRKSQDEEAAA